MVLAIWLFLRITASIWAAVVSSLRPITIPEQSISLWPPSSPFSGWLARAALYPLLRWDARWFVEIARNGYHTYDGTTSFHPLYPWLAAVLARTGIPELVSLLLISSAAGLFFLLTFMHMAQSEYGDQPAIISTMMLAVFPTACVLFVPYTEGLFLWFAALCLLWSRQHDWWRAGVAGFFAALARQQGLFLILPMAWQLWDAAGRRIVLNRQNIRSWSALSLPLLGMSCWTLYRAVVLKDFSPDFQNPHSIIYSFLISPNANHVVAFQTFTWPWVPLAAALQRLQIDPDIDLVISLVMSVWSLIFLVIAWRHLDASYRLYSSVMFLASFSLYTGSFQPYLGLARHLFLAFPVFLPLGKIVVRPWQRILLLVIALLGQLFLMMEYVAQVWVM